MILHWDYGVKNIYRQLAIITDLTLSLLLLLTLSIMFNDSARMIIAGGLLGILPDAMWLPEIISGKPAAMDGKHLLHRVRFFHHKIQHELAGGLIVEIIWFIAMTVIVFHAAK